MGRDCRFIRQPGLNPGPYSAGSMVADIDPLHRAIRLSAPKP
jgi:hypothetical protein